MLHRHATPAVAGSFVLGSLAGAAVTSAGLAIAAGLLRPIPHDWRGGLAICLVVLLAARESGLLCLDLPQRAWQIPQQIFHDDPRRAAFRFAFELGTGVRTYITTSAPYAVAVVLLLATPDGLMSLAATAAAGFGYGLGRSLIIAAQPVSRRMAVDHPPIWLRAASSISIACCLLIAARAVAS